jgi:hypothetical protein
MFEASLPRAAGSGARAPEPANRLGPVELSPRGRVLPAPVRLTGIKFSRSGYCPRVTVEPETIATVTKARNLLIILVATCKETLPALEAAANVLNTKLTDDLRLMIERSEGELRVVSEKLAALRATSA